MNASRTKKLVEQMLASFAAVLDREFHHKLEARELLQATKTDDKIKHLAGLTHNIHQRMEESADVIRTKQSTNNSTIIRMACIAQTEDVRCGESCLDLTRI